MPAPEQQLYEFGPFQLDPSEGVLRQDGKPVSLTQKAFQTLLVLVENGGRLVEKDELLQKVWPDTFVEESTLSQNIFTLRKKLGNDESGAAYIETVPKRGYRFAARVSTRVAPAASSSAHSSAEESADPARIRSLAVLPLQDHSGDPGQDYFADGMTEALITDLAKIKALRVISRTSAMQYKGARKSLPQIAAELGVDAVVQGSVLRSGSRVRITAQLIHARGDQHLWSESYERDFRDILSLQSEVARAIVDQIKIALTPQERVQLASAHPVNPQAHEFYLKGRFYWNKRSEEPVRKALAFFQQAIECDPTSGHAYAGLADSYNILGYYNGLLPREAFPKARAAAGKALELDESLAEGHAALGVVKRDFEWDWAGSELEFRRAIELRPAYADAHHWCGTLLYVIGRREEGLRWKTKALELDPLSMVINTDVGRLLYFGRHYEEAAKLYRKAIASDPDFWIRPVAGCPARCTWSQRRSGGWTRLSNLCVHSRQ